MHQRIILVVGPSGVGKTSVCNLVAGRLPTIKYRHLDGLAADWGSELGWLDRPSVSKLRHRLDDDQILLAFGLESIGMLAGSHREKDLLVNVGAGFQDASFAKHLHQIHDVIALTADPAVAFERRSSRSAESRGFEKYKQSEFSWHREAVYSQTRNQIDTTRHTLEECADMLECLVNQLVSRFQE